MSKPAIAGLILALAIVGFLIYTTFGNARSRVQVCVEYQGRTSCRIASGPNRETALRSATDNACAQIASGVTATMVCTTAPPKSVTWLR
jgi:hypothetical protein